MRGARATAAPRRLLVGRDAFGHGAHLLTERPAPASPRRRSRRGRCPSRESAGPGARSARVPPRRSLDLGTQLLSPGGEIGVRLAGPGTACARSAPSRTPAASIAAGSVRSAHRSPACTCPLDRGAAPAARRPPRRPAAPARECVGTPRAPRSRRTRASHPCSLEPSITSKTMRMSWKGDAMWFRSVGSSCSKRSSSRRRKSTSTRSQARPAIGGGARGRGASKKPGEARAQGVALWAQVVPLPVVPRPGGGGHLGPQLGHRPRRRHRSAGTDLPRRPCAGLQQPSQAGSEFNRGRMRAGVGANPQRCSFTYLCAESAGAWLRRRPRW